MTLASKRCVLAYSGGLDTSAIVPWLLDHGYEVHAVLVDVGQEEALEAMCARARRIGAATAVVRDATAEMAAAVLPLAIGLGAVYEGSYRLGTALARPFIAAAQVQRAREVGATTLVHGATGKGNDQVRFEHAYRSLAPDCAILAPWKIWSLRGRADLIAFLRERGIDIPFAEAKTYSLDENLWHLSVEGGVLEDPTQLLDVDAILRSVADRFAAGGADEGSASREIDLTFQRGAPVAIDGEPTSLIDILATLNRRYRHASWGWDLVLENRFTGVKSRGIYINPGAKLLHLAIDGLARSCLSKSAFEQYRYAAAQYAELLYRGEYFSQQRRIVEAAGLAATAPLTGTVTVQLAPTPHVARIAAEHGLFQHGLATFEASDFDHSDAAGFIKLTWLSAVGRPEPHPAGPTESQPHAQELAHESVVETGKRIASDVPALSSVSR